jgi:hypothetical protein
VGVKREGWRLGYYTDTINSHDEAYVRARQFFRDVIELCSEATDRETLKWDMRLSDWDKGSNTPCVNRRRRRKTTGDLLLHSGGDGGGDGADGADAVHSPVLGLSGIPGSGSPEDWPLLRCRAYLGLAILDQEGQGKVITQKGKNTRTHTHTRWCQAVVVLFLKHVFLCTYTYIYFCFLPYVFPR